MNIIRATSCLLFLFILWGCNRDIKFDKKKWQELGDAGQPLPSRREMLKDLTTDHKLIGSKYADVISLLGAPSFKNSEGFGYDVIVDYGSDIDPVYTKTLNFVFSKDSAVTSYKIIEWRKK